MDSTVLFTEPIHNTNISYHYSIVAWSGSTEKEGTEYTGKWPTKTPKSNTFLVDLEGQ
jgi:hypothetical protein